jgi:hypothetical protein
MLTNFPPEADGDGPIPREKGSSQRLLLLVLLLLVAAFGYLYFFTGLIRPREEAPKTPPVQPAQVKKPLPPRPEQSGTKPEAAVKPEGAQPAQAKPEKLAAPTALSQGKPAVAPAPKPAVTPAQPVLAKPAKVEEKPAPKTPAKDAVSPAAPAKTPVRVAEKPAPAAAAGQKRTAPVAAVKAVKPAVKRGAYTVLVGEFGADQDLRRLREKLKKLGLTPVLQKSNKPQLMHRLFIGSFDSHAAAYAEMKKVRQNTSAAFILKESGKYSVYAGSYLNEKGAAAERKRLASKGMKPTLKTAKVTIPIVRVTAGSFSAKGNAQKEANRLRKYGIMAKVSKIGSK